MFPLGKARFRKAFGDDYEEMNQTELFEELKIVIENLDVEDSDFRSNHASNYLPIKAHLPKDKENILKLIDSAIHDPRAPFIRRESMRGL